MFVEADLHECHGLPTNITPNRIHLETGKHECTPFISGQKELPVFWFDGPEKLRLLFMMFGVNTIIPDHFKMFFGYMDNQFLYEVEDRKSFLNILIIFMPVVMKGDGFPIVVINT